MTSQKSKRISAQSTLPGWEPGASRTSVVPSENGSTFHFNGHGHPFFDPNNPPRVSNDDGVYEPAGRPYSLNTIGNDRANARSFRDSNPAMSKAPVSPENSLDDLREKFVFHKDDFEHPVAEPRPISRRRRSSVLWINDSEGRPVLEVGLDGDGRYTVLQGTPQGFPEGSKEDLGNGHPRENGLANEKQGDEETGRGPPKPVGFWDKSLASTRSYVFKRWAIMSMCILPTFAWFTDLGSLHPLCLYPCHSVLVLGGPVRCQRQSQLNHRFCCKL